jgi:hypothetical protein
MDLRGEDHHLLTLATSDLGLAFATYASSSSGFINSRDTAIPQISGVTGATLGALLSLLGTPDAQIVSISSITGSVLGFGVGSYFSFSTPKTSLSLNLPLPDVDLTGWGFSAAPSLMEDGTQGMYFQLTKQ